MENSSANRHKSHVIKFISRQKSAHANQAKKKYNIVADRLLYLHNQ
jgi:hypothetical protein